MQHDPRRVLAKQALVAAEKAGLKVWQHLGAAYVGRPAVAGAEALATTGDLTFLRNRGAAGFRLRLGLHRRTGAGRELPRLSTPAVAFTTSAAPHAGHERMSRVILASARHPSAALKSPIVWRSQS